MMRLRRGNVPCVAPHAGRQLAHDGPAGCDAPRQPTMRCRSGSVEAAADDARRSRRRASSAARCAAPSMPTASPETTVAPASARRCPMRVARSRADGGGSSRADDGDQWRTRQRRSDRPGRRAPLAAPRWRAERRGSRRSSGVRSQPPSAATCSRDAGGVVRRVAGWPGPGPAAGGPRVSLGERLDRPGRAAVPATAAMAAAAEPWCSSSRLKVTSPTPGVLASAIQASRSFTLLPPARTSGRASEAAAASSSVPTTAAPAQVGDGASDAQGAVDAASGELQLVREVLESRGVPEHPGRRHAGVAGPAGRRWACRRCARGRAPRPRGSRWPTARLDSGWASLDESAGVQAWHHHAQVDAIEQRPADATPVALGLARRAAAGALGIAIPAAAAGVHGRDELQLRGVASPSHAPARSRPSRPRAAGAGHRARRGRTRPARRGRATPWWACVTRPGRSRGPPPTMAAYEVVWCGLRKGRRSRSAG